MNFEFQPTRRRFIQLAGAAASGAAVGLPSAVLAAKDDAPSRDPKAVLARLVEGNKRFVGGKSTRTPRTAADFAADDQGQAPLAAILGCADSRVSPELVFDQNIGELFVVRVAGNVASNAGPLVKGSLEFAVAELGVRLIMVLGHSKCGAVKAAIEHIDANDSLPGSIGGLVELIKPAVIAAKGLPGDKLSNVIKANVGRCVGRLKELEPILSKSVAAGELMVVGGVYELSTGEVEILG